jgi:hypothetical protein
MESRHSPLRLLLMGRNISLAKLLSLGLLPVYYILKFIRTDAGRSKQVAAKAKTAVERRFRLC